MSRNYEALFIFGGNVREDTADKSVDKVKSEIEKLGGTVEQADLLGRRQFARTMGKRDSGVYAKIRFSMDPQSIAPLHARYALDEDCFRVQITLRDERMEAAKAEDDKRRAAYKARQEQQKEETAAEAAEEMPAEMPAED